MNQEFSAATGAPTFYRTYRKFFDLVNPQYITWNFYQRYLDQEPPFGQLGAVVFLRTYSRFVPELGRREKFAETCLRVVEYSLLLDTVSTQKQKQAEAKQLFDCLFNLRGFASGRAYWIAGTPQTKKCGSAAWNCCFRTIDDISAFSEVFYWLLLGAGVGFSIEKKYISQLPQFKSDKSIVHEDYNFNGTRYEHTRIVGDRTYLFDGHILQINDLIVDDANFLANTALHKERHVTIYVGDSKEGWCNALRVLLYLLTLPNLVSITFNYDNVRPKGERIKVFGGRASGHQNIQDILQRTFDIVKSSGGQLSSLDVLDLVNSIGLGVVSGGVRRTAEIALGDADDIHYIEAKLNLWTDESKAAYRDTRVMSNNSVVFYQNPGIEEIRNIVNRIKTNGEPGFSIVGNAQKYDPNIAGFNPCHEAALSNKQSCNLTTQNLLAHVVDGKLNSDLLEQTLRLITRIGCRQTTATQWHPEWDKVQKRDRLLGVSMTGVEDAFDVLNWTEQQQIDFYNWAADIVRDEADKYNEHLGIERSTRVTLVKPEGTLSQLPTVSSGIGKAYAPYYLRRVRFSRLDPLAIALHESGFLVVPENGQGDDLFSEQCNTWVFTFPIKTNATMRAIDEPIDSQFQRYLNVQTSYVREGYNASNTMTVSHDEWDEAAELVYKHWDDIIGITFLPRFDPREGGNAAYPNMPYEPCEAEEYQQLSSALPKLSESQIIELIARYEQSDEEQLIEDDCATGACPIR